MRFIDKIMLSWKNQYTNKRLLFTAANCACDLFIDLIWYQQNEKYNLNKNLSCLVFVVIRRRLSCKWMKWNNIGFLSMRA